MFQVNFKVTASCPQPWRYTPVLVSSPFPPAKILNATHLLMLRVLRTHNINPPLPPHDTAPIAHNLHTGADLHPSRQRGCCSRHSRQWVVVMLVLDMVGELDGGLAQALEERAARGEQWSEHCGWWSTTTTTTRVQVKRWREPCRRTKMCARDLLITGRAGDAACSGP